MYEQLDEELLDDATAGGRAACERVQDTARPGVGVVCVEGFESGVARRVRGWPAGRW
ncbi:hypothetical protein ACIPLC_36915 [Kitasatospora sp. NPDC086801]|uniref:hypothetical protein n=1 Tax=Kitasatospora sp. NPDC086801 TaxID=3364066 RepID=UPI00380CB814